MYAYWGQSHFYIEHIYMHNVLADQIEKKMVKQSRG